MTKQERGVASQASQVTFFEDRAEVVRRAKLQLPPGKSWQTLEGVTPFVDDRSVQARVVDAPGVTVLGARVLRRLDAVPLQDESEAALAEAAAREARSRAVAARQGRERATAQLGGVESLVEAWSAGMRRVPAGIAADVSPWREAYEALAAEARAALEAAAGAHALELRAGDEVRATELRFAASSSMRTRWEGAVQVQLERSSEGPGDEPLEVVVEITYRTPCALWRPEHLARLERESPESREGELSVRTFAVAWQATGESWEGVKAAFSTARPGRAASAPKVSDDLLRSREKSAEERKEVVVEARDQEVSLTGAQGKREVNAMPGVDDGGEPLTLHATAPVDIPSSGQPFRVETGVVTYAAALSRTLLPEVSPVAHLRAEATHTQAQPLLAGPTRLALGEGGRQHLVGRAKLGFVGAGEPFELGFGPDDAVRVQRRIETERDTTLFRGAQTIKREVFLDLSNLSTDVKAIVIKERVPVAEIDEISVSVEAKGWTQDEDGFLTRSVELPPRGTASFTFSYTLKASAKVRLPYS